MPHKLAYFMPAREDMLQLFESRLPEGLELVRISEWTEEARNAVLPELDFLISGSVTEDILERAKKVRFIQTPGVGYDGVDFDACKAKGIPVAHTLSGITTEVAEHVFMLILAVVRKLIDHDRSMREGKWTMFDHRLTCHTIAGKKLGLVGMGRIGKAVAKRADAFEMEVLYHDLVDVEGYQKLSMEDLLAQSDIVSVHVPLTPDTRGMFNASRFSQMKDNAVFLNASRGEVVNEKDLHEALTNGKLYGAGLDVFDGEPPSPDNPLRTLDNVVLTPHTATGTYESHCDKIDNYIRNIENVLAGRPIEGQLA